MKETDIIRVHGFMNPLDLSRSRATSSYLGPLLVGYGMGTRFKYRVSKQQRYTLYFNLHSRIQHGGVHLPW